MLETRPFSLLFLAIFSFSFLFLGGATKRGLSREKMKWRGTALAEIGGIPGGNDRHQSCLARKGFTRWSG